MPTISVNGYDVHFPFEPYPAQLAYMKAVLDALDGGANALLESPTGTGKTLCLLCAALAWTLDKRRHVQRQPRFDPASGLVDAEKVDRYKIVYCSRTHAQLTQVVRELKRAIRSSSTVKAAGATAVDVGADASDSPRRQDEEEKHQATLPWPEVSMALLGSREHMCVNSEVARLPSSHAQQSMCSALRADKSCRFFMGLQVNRAEGCLPTNDEGDTLYDMEDLVAEGKRGGFCPYFLERDLAKHADIVFMPYNYIFDSQLRRQLPFELNKSCVLIVDEAHNLPSVLSAAGCLTLLPLELANAIQDCTRAIAMQRLLAEQDGADEQLGLLRGDAFASLKLLLARLEAAIADEEGDKDKTPSSSVAAGGSVAVSGELVLPGPYMGPFLARALITREVYDGTTRSTGMNDTISQAIEVLAESEKPAMGLSRVQQFLSAVFASTMDDSTRFIVKDEAVRPASSGSRADSSAATAVTTATVPRRRSLGFWRLDSSSELLELSQQLRCLLLTSGTLSPLDHFAAELGAPFPVRLCGSHVIAPHQVLGGVLCRGPTGDRLNGSYALRNSVDYRTALGMTLVNISRIAPGGMLVFFPSYAALNSAVDLWRAGSGKVDEAKTVWGLVSETKPIFVEPSGSGELAPIVAEFQRAVQESPRRGAVLLAVCRGKVSEGIDFADNDGRCVLVTGIPFANHTDLFVRLKRQYLTDVAPRRPRVDGKLFTGDSWYRHEAMRAVNQAIGRVIRHKDDYGAIVLADERFAGQVGSLPDWVAQRSAVHHDFRGCYPALAKFFSEHYRDGNRNQHAQLPVGSTRLGVSSSSSGNTPAVTSTPTGAAAAAVPLSAELAKRYARERQRELEDEERRRQGRRLEEAAEKPERHAAVVQSILLAPGANTGPGGACSPPAEAEAPSRPPQAPQLRSFATLLASHHAAPASGDGAVVTAASALPVGSTSKELCAFLKERVSAASYEAFKAALKAIAALRGGLHGTPETLAATRREFGEVVEQLHVIFAQAVPSEVAGLAQEFSRHIPAALRPLYDHFARKHSRHTSPPPSSTSA